MNTTESYLEKSSSLKKQKMLQSSESEYSKKLSNKNVFQSEKPKFQSQDSEGSDISYESSIQSEQDINIGRIQYFKQEMGRFFINYPELINNDIIEKDTDLQYSEGLFSNYSKNWSILSKQILTESKQSSTFLQALAKRIAVYRSKIQQQDIIDVLLKQQKNIMKQIDSEINAKKKQVTKGNKNLDNMNASDNMFFSWRKKQQMDFISNFTTKNNNKTNEQKQKCKDLKRSQTDDKNKSLKSKTIITSQNQNITTSKSKTFYKENVPTQNNFFLTSANQESQSRINQRRKLTTQRKPTFPQNTKTNENRSLHKARSIFSKQKQKTGKFNELFDNQSNNQKQKNSLNRSQHFWKHLMNFEAKTEAGRQLCQIIRKNCNPNDELGIKKTILSYLSKNKEMIKNQIIHKSTISQKIQKLYNDDSKELLMFYPTKLNIMSQSNDRESLNSNKQIKTSVSLRGSSVNKESQKFMKILQEITQGPLMKYWIQLQQNKL